MADDKKDLKKDDKTSVDKDQVDDKNKDKDADDETVSKEDYDKMVEERDNYKKGLLEKKSKDRSLKNDDSDEEDEEEEEDGSDTSVDVKAEVDKGISAFKAEAEKSNEQRAKAVFFKNHSEYLEDVTWKEFIGGDFASRRGMATVEDIIDDLEDGHLVRMKRLGKLEEYLDSQTKQSEAEEQAKANAQAAAGANGAGDQQITGQGEKQKLTPKGEKIARGMHVDPKDASKIDLSKDNSISAVSSS